MSKYRFFAFFAPLRNYFSAFSDFLSFLGSFVKSKLVSFSFNFEKYKNILVKFFMMKRGRYVRPFLHMSTIGALTLGVIAAPFLASTYPVFSQNSTTSAQIGSSSQGQSIVVGENVFQTDISQKPRDKVITYT